MNQPAKLPEIWDQQFLETREIPGHGLCAIERYGFTDGLLTNVRVDGWCYDYERRYCYPVRPDARKALHTWDGQGDPPGEWVKEKVSGRCREKKS